MGQQVTIGIAGVYHQGAYLHEKLLKAKGGLFVDRFDIVGRQDYHGPNFGYDPERS